MLAALVAGLPALALPGCGRIDFRNAPVDAAADAAVDTAVSDAIDASSIDPCAPTYTTMIGQSYYRFSVTPTSWDTAEHACEADGRGSHLVVFGDTLEMNMVEAMVNGTELWIGLTDRVTDDNFLDVMGEKPGFLPSWQNMDPSFAGPGCVKFNPSSRLIHDQDCTAQFAYVCECDGVLARPSSY